MGSQHLMGTEFEFCRLERARETDVVAAAHPQECASPRSALSSGYDGECDVMGILR